MSLENCNIVLYFSATFLSSPTVEGVKKQVIILRLVICSQMQSCFTSSKFLMPHVHFPQQYQRHMDEKWILLFAKNARQYRNCTCSLPIIQNNVYQLIFYDSESCTCNKEWQQKLTAERRKLLRRMLFRRYTDIQKPLSLSMIQTVCWRTAEIA